MNPFKTIKRASTEVYTKKAYITGTITFAVIFFSLNALIRNYRLLFHDFSFVLLVSLIGGTFTSIALTSIISLIVISLLAGMTATWGYFLFKRQRDIGIAAGTPGIVVALLAPACPSCALGLFGFLGIGGLVGILPFKGLELGFIGILLLLASLWYLGSKITTTSCPISEKRTKKK